MSRSRVVGALIALVLALAASLAAPMSAQAHGNVVASSTPAADAQVTELSTITITFTEPVRPDLAHFTLRATDGTMVALSDPTFDAAKTTVTFAATSTVADGWYRIGYQVVVGNGDTSNGSIRVQVSASGSAIPDPEAASAVPHQPSEVGADWSRLWLGLGIAAGVVVIAAAVIVLIRRRR